ncbi:peptidase, putative [Cordyceps militaris CM01]|uniref:Peptidase, putative n=1 Tax=Cordyceps militaris (strain CM01) TaxID=983644 RepID=G3J3C1_CORMM|nr:peptidase, putative [Cordyceps militaris CM01]EGX95651.1 peptidase, putative [Cordyceps militaris CM01]
MVLFSGLLVLTLWVVDGGADNLTTRLRSGNVTETESPPHRKATGGGAESVILVTTRPSVPLPEPSVSASVTSGEGTTTAKNTGFRPRPDISKGPPHQWTNTTTWATTTSGSAEPTSILPDPPYTSTRQPFHAKCPPTEHYVAEFDATITLSDCHGPTNLEWGCAATTTVAIAAPTDKTVSLGCTAFTGTGEALPTYTDWPPGEIEFEEDDRSSEDGHTACNLWFLNGRVKIRGIHWKFPGGIVLPPGPPPNIKLPPGITIPGGKLPGPWPPVTLGRDGKITYPTNEPTECKTKSAEICSTTESIIITTTANQQPLTTTSTVSSCQTIHGCHVEDDDSTTTKQCTGGSTTTLGRRAIPAATATAQVPFSVLPESNLHLGSRYECPAVVVDDYIIYPTDPDNVRYLVDYLKNTPSQLDNSVKLWEKATQVHGGAFTAFFYIDELTNMEAQHMKSLTSLGVGDFYAIVDTNNAAGFTGSGSNEDIRPPDRGPWELSQISTPPGGKWSDAWDNKNNPQRFDYDAGGPLGRGQTIYLVEDDVDQRAFELSSAKIRYIDAQNFPPKHTGDRLLRHGTQVGSIIVGKTLGLARNAELVVVRNSNSSPRDPNMHIHDRYLASLVAILDEIVSLSPAQLAKVVINMSFGWEERQVEEYMKKQHFAILFFDKFGVAMVAATHNKNNQGPIYRQKINGWPSRFADPNAPPHEKLENLIVVSGIDINSVVSPLNPYMNWIAMAPGFGVHVANEESKTLSLADGASLAAPHITALIAYWRSLNLAGSWGSELERPVNVKKLVMYMHRSLEYRRLRIPDLPEENPNKMRVPFIWTGSVKGGGNCLVQPTLEGCPPELKARSKIADLKPRGADCAGTSGSTRKRQGDDSCPLVRRPGSPSGGDDGDTLTFKPTSTSSTSTSSTSISTTSTSSATTSSATTWSTGRAEPTSDPTPYYDCKGDALCSTLNVKFCDLAVNNMERGNKIYMASSGTIAGRGNCWASRFGYGCSVQIRGKDGNGKDCKISGDKIWDAYQDIRKAGDCRRCGSKHFGNGCLVSIDYAGSCSNRIGGVN